ncbi:MAG: hypothetical protein WAO78_14985 [Roseovarius sp.]
MPDVITVTSCAVAALGRELTVPEVVQSIIRTRASMKSISIPEHDTLETITPTGATPAIHLGLRNLREIKPVLSPPYGEGVLWSWAAGLAGQIRCSFMMRGAISTASCATRKFRSWR